MRRLFKSLISFFEFLVVIIIIFIFGIVLITAVDILELADIPEQYSLAKYLKSTTEIPINENLNNQIDENTIINSIEKVEGEQQPQIDYTQVPEGIESVYSANDNTSTTSNNLVEKYYYSQLNEYGKIFYDKMYLNKENLKNGNYIVDFDKQFNNIMQQENGSAIVKNAFQAGLNALMYDNPEFFYLDIAKMYLYTETTTIILKKTYRIYIGPEEGKDYFAVGFNSRQDVENAILQINQKISTINGINSGSDYTKIMAVHDYLIDNTSYDQTISMNNIYNIYGTLINNVAVCEGYSKAFKYILDYIGINNIIVSGIGVDNDGKQESHAWNYVFLRGNWYAVDVTWDDPIIVGNGKLNSKYRYRYFLKGFEEFGRDHFEDGNIVENVQFSYPVLSNSNY